MHFNFTGCGTSGKAMKCCDARLCLHAICPSNANAVCRIDPCNDCAVEFYDYMNRKVDDCYAGMHIVKKLYSSSEKKFTAVWSGSFNKYRSSFR